MSNLSKLGKILRKLVLSSQVLLGAIGIIGIIFNLVTGIHDVPFSQKAEKCFMSVLSQDYNTEDKALKKQMKEEWKEWINFAEDIINIERSENNNVSPIEKRLSLECSKYFRLAESFDGNSINVYVNTWFKSNPVTWSDRMKPIFGFLFIPGFLIALLQGLVFWTRWLFK